MRKIKITEVKHCDECGYTTPKEADGVAYYRIKFSPRLDKSNLNHLCASMYMRDGVTNIEGCPFAVCDAPTKDERGVADGMLFVLARDELDALAITQKALEVMINETASR